MLFPLSFNLACACALLPLAVLGTSAFGANPTVTVSNGQVVGTTTLLPHATAHVNKFLGIPFAKSPPERFSPPQAASDFSGSLTAQAYKPACIQQFNYPALSRNITLGVFNSPPPPAGESEDCLYVNVWAPSGPAPAEGWPVMFWIFGGGFQFGSGTLYAYDGSAFASYQDVILVTHGYRTNVFGFPSAPDLPLTGQNLGLLDQHFALQWVQDNIAAFGGDKDKVTIFGESAGGFSVDALLTAFTTETAPFRAAILESGQISYNAAPSEDFDFVGVNSSAWNALIEALDCPSGSDQLACARAAPALTIQNIAETLALTFSPVADNLTLVSDPAYRRQVGNFAAVPILIGTNANEGRVFSLGEGDLDAFLQEVIGPIDASLIPAIEAAFPSTNGYDTISDLTTLLTFQCGSALMANETAFARDVPTWRYFYNATFPNLSPFGGLLQVYHSSELSIVFGTYPGGPVNPTTPGILEGDLPTLEPPTAQQEALSKYMNTAWASFAKNPMHGPGWNRLGTFNGADLGVIGGQNGLCGGVEIVNRTDVDGPCQVLLPAFKIGTGNVYGLTGV